MLEQAGITPAQSAQRVHAKERRAMSVRPQWQQHLQRIRVLGHEHPFGEACDGG